VADLLHAIQPALGLATAMLAGYFTSSSVTTLLVWYWH
jgi:hypothetical protein